VELLVDKGADFNARSDRGGTPLYGAAAGGHEELVDWLIGKGADLDAALFCAVWPGDLDAAKLLVDKGASVNARDDQGRTPLHQAASYGHKEVAELLIDRGADVNAKDNHGGTPAYTAVSVAFLFSQQQIVDMVQFLLARGAEEDIHLAAFSRDLETMKRLLQEGIDVDKKITAQIGAGRSNVLTPLCMAAIGGQKHVVEFLIAQGADVNAKVRIAFPEPDSGPLSLALIYPDDAMAKLLIDKGANVKAGGFLGSPLWTLMLSATIRGADVFQEPDLDVGFSNEEWDREMNKMDARGTEYSQRIWPELRRVMELLLAHSASVNEKGLRGSTLLHYAAEAGFKDAAALFIANGADVNAKDDEGKTPLVLAREEGHVEIVTLLQEHGARE
jgi:ankyrin repeat protein